MLILLLVVDLVDALHKGNAEVELAALDGGLLDLAEAGLNARVAWMMWNEQTASTRTMITANKGKIFFIIVYLFIIM